MEIILCTKCNGKGKQLKDISDDLRKRDWTEILCDRCSGSGRLYKWQPAALTQPMTFDGLKCLSDLSSKIVNVVRNHGHE